MTARTQVRARGAARILALAGLVAAGAASAQENPRIEAGRAAMEAGDTSRARASFTEAVNRGDAVEASLGEYYLALMSDEALDLPAALAGYRHFVARDPGSRFAARAMARIDDLEAHSEGRFVPLAALERVRRSPDLSNDAHALEALDAQAGTWPPGNVRAEAWLLVGEAYLGRMQRPRDAARVFLRLARDDGASAAMRELAATRLVAARAVLGESVRAEQELSGARVTDAVRAEAAVLARRVRLGRGATWVLGILGAATAAGIAAVLRRGQLSEVLRRWRRPMPLVQLAVLTVGGAALAKASDDHEVRPFLLLGGGVLAVYLAAVVLNVAGGTTPGARAARAAVCVLAVLSVAFLTMLRCDPMMLEGIGL